MIHSKRWSIGGSDALAHQCSRCPHGLPTYEQFVCRCVPDSVSFFDSRHDIFSTSQIIPNAGKRMSCHQGWRLCSRS